MPSTHKLSRRMKRRTKMVMKKMLANELSLVVLCFSILMFLSRYDFGM